MRIKIIVNVRLQHILIDKFFVLIYSFLKSKILNSIHVRSSKIYVLINDDFQPDKNMEHLFMYSEQILRERCRDEKPSSNKSFKVNYLLKQIQI